MSRSGTSRGPIPLANSHSASHPIMAITRQSACCRSDWMRDERISSIKDNFAWREAPF